MIETIAVNPREQAYYDQFSGEYPCRGYAQVKFTRNEFMVAVNDLLQRGFNLAEAAECLGRKEGTLKPIVRGIRYLKDAGFWNDERGQIKHIDYKTNTLVDT